MKLLQWLCPHPASALNFISAPRYEDKRIPVSAAYGPGATHKVATYRVHTCRMLCCICAKEIELTVSSDVMLSDE